MVPSLKKGGGGMSGRTKKKNKTKNKTKHIHLSPINNFYNNYMRSFGSIALASSVRRLTLRRLLHTHNIGVRPLAPLYVLTPTFVKVVCA